MSPEPPARRSVVYLSGPPGSGKSTLMAHLTRYCPRETLLKPFAHDLLSLPVSGLPLFSGTAVELGRRRDTFPGTDTLSMSVIGPAETYLARGGRAHGLILGEGDRLANRRFFNSVRTLGWHLHVIHLTAPFDVLEERCAARGSKQSTPWRNGRFSKARNLLAAAKAQGHHVLELDTRNSVECLAVTAVTHIPVLAALLPSHAAERTP